MNMKKFLLSILCCLMAVVNGYAAAEVTYTVTSTSAVSVSGTAPAGSSATFKNTYTSNKVQLTKNNSMTLTLTGYAGNKITGITLSMKSNKLAGAGNFSATVGATTISSISTANFNTNSWAGTWSTSYIDVTPSVTATEVGTGENVVLKIAATANSLYCQSITITYEPIGGGDDSGETPVAPNAPTLTESCSFFNAMNVEITNNAENATVYYTTDGTDPSASNGIEYTDPFEITETTTVKAVAVKDELESEVVSATYTAIDPNATNYKIVASEQGYENGQAVTSLNFGVVTATFASNGGTSPAYYNTGSAIRAYAKNTITFTGAVGITITEIKFTFATGEGTNAITVNPGTFSTSTNTWTGASNEVKFTIGGTSGHRRIATIEVTYAVDGNTVVIATPSITASTSFVGSTTVEVTNNEAGTTLYYSMNGEDYTEYTGALTISETTTVSAYSQDAEGNKSSVAEATFTKIEVLTIAEAKTAFDNAGSDVDVAVDLTGAVVTVNSGQYLFIENETTGINLYNSGADYAVGTKFTAGYILGKSTQYGKMHQITGADFNNVETTTVAVEPMDVEIADIKGQNAEYEGRFVKLSGVSIDVDGKTITKGEDTYALYNRFALELTDVVKCDVEGIVAIYNTTEQLYITKVTPAYYELHVTPANYATLFLDYATVIPTGVKAYAVTEVNNGYVSMTQIEGVLPANTGVIVEAVKGDYAFVAAANNASAISGNKLLGTTVDTDIDVEAYVLSMVDGEVGLYKAEMAGGVFLNNAYKAYLPASAVPNAVQGASGFKFRFETTGIEGVQVAQGKKAIYDLSGRKVNDMKAPGLYIVNGKKVLVK